MPDPRKSVRRVPWFFPVPVTPRADGWTAARQVMFVGFLRQTGSVGEAATRVGMSREGAYRLRQREWAAGFAAAWDAALDRHSPPQVSIPYATAQQDLPRKPKVTMEELFWRFETGLWRPVMRNRRFVRIARKPCTTTLLQFLARLDQAHGSVCDEAMYGGA